MYVLGQKSGSTQWTAGWGECVSQAKPRGQVKPAGSEHFSSLPSLGLGSCPGPQQPSSGLSDCWALGLSPERDSNPTSSPLLSGDRHALASPFPPQGGQGAKGTTLRAGRGLPNSVDKAWESELHVSEHKEKRKALPTCRKSLQPSPGSTETCSLEDVLPCDLHPTHGMVLISSSARGWHPSIWAIPTPSEPTGISGEPGYILQLLLSGVGRCSEGWGVAGQQRPATITGYDNSEAKTWDRTPGS